MSDITVTDAAERSRLEREYEASDRYLDDALQFVADFGHEDPIVVAVARTAYRNSHVFRRVVDDACDGERRF